MIKLIIFEIYLSMWNTGGLQKPMKRWKRLEKD
jgi:hypothetical protein